MSRHSAPNRIFKDWPPQCVVIGYKLCGSYFCEAQYGFILGIHNPNFKDEFSGNLAAMNYDGGGYLQDDGNAASNFRFEKNNIYGNDLSSGNNYGLVNRTGTEIDLKKNFWGRPAVRGLIRRMMLMTLEPVPSPTPTPPQNPTRSKPKSEGFNLMWTDDPTLAEVFVGGANVNLEMVKAGFAEAHRGRPARGFNTVLYQNAEKDARDQERGMWVQNSDDYVSPKAWRENKRKSSSS